MLDRNSALGLMSASVRCGSPVSRAATLRVEHFAFERQAPAEHVAEIRRRPPGRTPDDARVRRRRRRDERIVAGTEQAQHRQQRTPAIGREPAFPIPGFSAVAIRLHQDQHIDNPAFMTIGKSADRITVPASDPRYAERRAARRDAPGVRSEPG
ncbi:hypothetical protein [Sphingomonas sp. Leaf343]|uniref:hypothetical protein n=1 Tax=Sphingomonas sp. Leaf343 TaxID=1736345 RepID=UPI00191BE515|nr:hypothetical protein [Sphingomonas sp. Leaf343]